MSAPSSSQALEISDLQKEAAAALRDFYKFLTKLPWLEPDDVLEPPEQGWPNINNENFGPFHKNSAVLQLLKYLPYIRMDGPRNEYKLAWSTYPCDYRRNYFQKIAPDIDCWEIPDTTERNFTFPEWVIPITYGKVHGQYIMLDTTDGTAFRYEVQWLHEPVYEANDPQAWRNQCANPGSTARLSDILNEWKDDYMQLRLIGQPSNNSEPLLHTETSGEEYKELREIMLRHGWPGNFDRESCKIAMLDWEEKKLLKLFNDLKNR